mmetsp:Transcript_28514/g.69104  ORF Transcript_28514/g.69104 Transcript_28514/m.69104 type:complete len:115 (+) Transcript_28514:772-1116(+)
MADGMETVTSWEQPEKQGRLRKEDSSRYIVRSESLGISTPSRLGHLSKAVPLSTLSECGSDMPQMDWQPAKALMPIPTNPSFSSTSTKARHPWKAAFPMLYTELGMDTNGSISQ